MTRLLFAGAIAMLISLIGTKALINWLTTHRIGQPIRDDGPEGDEETRKRRKDEPLLAPGAKRNGNGSGLTRH